MEFQQQLLCSQLMERPLMLEEVRKLTVIIRALTVIVIKNHTYYSTSSDYDPLNATYSVVPDSAEELCVIEIMVAINDDSTPEPEQCFYLQIESSDSWVNIGPSSLTISISDNDSQCSITLSLPL